MDDPTPFEDELQRYRDTFMSPSALLGWLTARSGRKGLLGGMAGLGKSTATRTLLASPELHDHFDQVLCMVDQNRVLAEYERDLRLHLPPQIAGRLVVLRARPAGRCGEFDTRWKALEASRCGALGRSTLCATCRAREGCAWPGQGDVDRLRNARVILGVQEFLRIHPALLERRAGIRKLVILEEARDVSGTTTVRIDRGDLEAFGRVVAAAGGAGLQDGDQAALERLGRSLDHLKARDDLARVPRIPALGADLTARLEDVGRRMPSGLFRNLLPDLHALQRRHPRWYDDRGGVCFRDTLSLGPHTVLILSAGTPMRLVQEKLGLADLEVVTEAGPPMHPGTRYINLHNFAGARSRFPGNRKRLLDFAAGVAVRALDEGRRVLLVSCAEFEDACRQEMEARLAVAAGAPVRIHMAGGPDEVVPDTARVALIHYGMTGTNSFEHFEVCICLNSYYVPPAAIAMHLRDVLPHGTDASVQIVNDAHGDRRLVIDSDSLAVRELAHDIFFQVEALVVLQAIGRCRLNTQPRLVILMHCGDLRLGKVEVAETLEDARGMLGLVDARTSGKASRAMRVSQLFAEGLDVRQVIARTGFSKATIYRLRKESHGI